MNKYYLYLHRRASDNKVFYVGKGSGKRAWITSKRNRHWSNVVNKHGYTVEIVFENLSEQDAFQCEIDAILEMKYLGEPLTNMTNGGEGVSGMVVSEETRKKISIAGTGRIKSEETRKKLSRALSGRKLSVDQILILSKSKVGKPAPNADRKNHKFINDNLGICEICTRAQLCQKYNIHYDLIKKLFVKNPRKTSKGWRLSND